MRSLSVTSVWPYAAVVASIVSFSIGTATAKGMFPAIGAEATVTLRVVFSALLMAVIFRPWQVEWSRSHLRRTLCFGWVLGAMNLSLYLSLRTLPLGVALGIEFMGPLGVALVGARRLSHVLWVALAAAGLGMLLPLTGQDVDPVGAGFAALAAIFWALYIVLGARLSGADRGRSLALGMIAAAVLVAPVGALPIVNNLPAFTPAVLILGLVVAVMSSALPYSLEMAALRHMPRRTFGVMMSLDPAVGALSGLILLHERLTDLHWLAIACIVVASVGAAATGTRKIPAQAPVPADTP